MTTTRVYHTVSLLPGGRVLVAGGYGLGGYLASAEIYDPATGTWTATGAMNATRQKHTMTLLPNGKVLVVGGERGGVYLSGAELYDPATGMWTLTSALGSIRTRHTATVLADGRVLVAAGLSVGGITSSAVLYDAGIGSSASWQPQIATCVSPLGMGDRLPLTGLRFCGVSGASGGTSQDSSSAYPVVQLRSLESAQTLWLRATAWSANSYLSAAVSGLPPGWTWVTVFVNGIPSASSMMNLIDNMSVFTPFQQWQLDNFSCLDCAQAAAEGDFDGDGMSNLNEYLAGTTPTSAASVFKVEQSNLTSDGFSIIWQSVPGKTYKVLYADSPGGPWREDLPNPQQTAADGQTRLSYSDTTIGTATKRSYRVRVLGP